MGYKTIPRTWKINTNQELEKIYSEVFEEAKKQGFINKKPKFYVFKSSSYWGMNLKNSSETINAVGINEVFCENEKKARETIIHELAHACLDVKEKHSYKWFKTGNTIGQKWNIKMSVTDTEKDMGITISKERKDKYVVVCPHCHAEWKRERMCNLVKNPERYRCSICNTKLERKTVLE